MVNFVMFVSFSTVAETLAALQQPLSGSHIDWRRGEHKI